MLGRRFRSPDPCPPLPPHAPGMRIGILGGTFDPPHAAHRMITLTALRRLGLDAVWWLVTPGNPLKNTNRLPASEARAQEARALARHPRIHVTTVEEAFGTRFTRMTLEVLKSRCPGVHLVWLMGSDNLQGFHRWQRWTEIMKIMPVAVFDRPGSTHRAGTSRAGIRFASSRLPETSARALVTAKPPAWIFVHGRRSALSSTAIRAQRKARH